MEVLPSLTTFVSFRHSVAPKSEGLVGESQGWRHITDIRQMAKWVRLEGSVVIFEQTPTHRLVP